MSHIQDYKILTGASATELTAIVRRYLELGWELVGCAQLRQPSFFSDEWYQTMVKLKTGTERDKES